MIEDHSSCIRISDAGICKNCDSKNIIKNGTTKTKKQQYICKSCHKRFIEFYSYKAYKKNINSQIIQLTKEGLEIRSTARVLNISTTTLLRRIIKIADDISQPKISFYQSYELDEMRFFIRKKSNPQWLVYAIDKKSKIVAGFYIGKRTNKTLKAVITTLLNSNPEKIYTDKLRNYQYLIPKEIHQTKRFETNSIERKKEFKYQNPFKKIHQKNNLLQQEYKNSLCSSENLLLDD